MILKSALRRYKNVFLVIITITVIVIAGGVIWNAYRLYLAEQRANLFLSLISDGEYSIAFDLCLPGMQDELLNNPENLNINKHTGLELETWVFTDYLMEENRAYLSGVITGYEPAPLLTVWLKFTDEWMIGEFWVEIDN